MSSFGKRVGIGDAPALVFLALVGAGCGGGGSVSAGDFEGVWQEMTGTSTTVCNGTSTTGSLTASFDLRFQSNTAGGLDLLTLDQNDVMVAGSCVVTYVVSGAKAALTGPQVCTAGTTTVTWTQDDFTLSSDHAALDEVGTLTNASGCTVSDTIHYVRKGGGTGGTGGTGCALCDKAGACCLAVAASAQGCDIYSAAMCNAQPAAAQSAYVMDICQTLLNTEASSTIAECH